MTPCCRHTVSLLDLVFQSAASKRTRLLSSADDRPAFCFIDADVQPCDSAAASDGEILSNCSL